MSGLKKVKYTAVVKFKNGQARIFQITNPDLLAGFYIDTQLSGGKKYVRYQYTDSKNRRIYMEWSNEKP